jgi:regulator of nonsense transcripts 1
MSPRHKCEYCEKVDHDQLLVCFVCKRQFCNGKFNSQTSHILMHLKSTGHNALAKIIPDSTVVDEIKCRGCNVRTVFSLGALLANNGDRNILCRAKCMNSAESDSHLWEPLVYDGLLASWLCPAPAQDKENLKLVTVTQERVNEFEKMRLIKPQTTLSEITVSPRIKVSAIQNRLENESDYGEKFLDLVHMEAETSEAQARANVYAVERIRWYGNKCRFTLADKLIPTDWEVETRIRVITNTPREWETTGVIWEILPHGEIDVHLDSMPRKIPDRAQFEVGRCWDDTTFSRMKHALKNFVSLTSSVRSIVLGKKQGTKGLTTGFPIPECLNVPSFPSLNKSQKWAIRQSLLRTVSLIQGPPGTGKTAVTSALVYHIAKNLKGSKILVCAPTNQACDNLTQKISQTGVVVLRVVAKCLEGSSSIVRDNCLHAQVEKLLPAEVMAVNSGKLNGEKVESKTLKKLRKRIRDCEDRILEKAQIVCCTCITAGRDMLQSKRFSHVLIDESAHATEPACLIPMMMGAEQVCLIGDHCQLQPTVLNQHAAHRGLSDSLFGRLVRLGHEPLMLNMQYRMHPGLLKFPSLEFYSGNLINGVSTKDRQLPDSDVVRAMFPSAKIPLVFYHVDGKEQIPSNGRSYMNPSEGVLVEQVVSGLISGGVAGSRIAVMTFYAGQNAVISSCLRNKSNEHDAVEVRNIDAFQGREKDFCILSCVRSNQNLGIGFLRDSGRMNVALTRARYALVICGNANTLAGKGSNGRWKRLMEFLASSGLVVTKKSGRLEPFQLTRKNDKNKMAR